LHGARGSRRLLRHRLHRKHSWVKKRVGGHKWLKKRAALGLGGSCFSLLCLAYLALTFACPTENWLLTTRTKRTRTIIRINKLLKNIK
jgi:hypothetical protein